MPSCNSGAPGTSRRDPAGVRSSTTCTLGVVDNEPGGGFKSRASIPDVESQLNTSSTAAVAMPRHARIQAEDWRARTGVGLRVSRAAVPGEPGVLGVRHSMRDSLQLQLPCSGGQSRSCFLLYWTVALALALALAIVGENRLSWLGNCSYLSPIM